jgi:hypothetical protein
MPMMNEFPRWNPRIRLEKTCNVPKVSKQAAVLHIMVFKEETEMS